ncbi:MAG: dihydrolipoyl dehydrogenase [Oscillospiraceae bacterium]|nr:dihydrolipoyl dehydrogenase [Oscillospiraceae bacterium]
MANKTIQVEIAVLGGGPAGYTAALRSAQLGANVALIEQEAVGGTCLNQGCIPTKTLLGSSGLMAELKHAREFGLEIQQAQINWDGALKQKDRVVKMLQSGVVQLLKTRGVTVIAGKGQVQSPERILVPTSEGTWEVECKKLILATGAKPAVPPIPGIDLPGVLTSTDALSIAQPPKQMVIIGAGVIGLEFANVFAPLGTKISVVEQQEEILPGVDEEITAELLKQLKRQGISVSLSTAVREIRQTGEGLLVLCQKEEKELALECDTVLVAVGRRLATEAFGALQLKMQRGAVCVDERMETSIPGVYAAGDITGGKLLAHSAFAKGRIAAESAVGKEFSLGGTVIPACIYTTPEVASVGMTEAEAKLAFGQIHVGKCAFRSNGRALSLRRREGFVKVIADEAYRIVGGHILGAEASEVISSLSLAVNLGLKAENLAQLIYPHPSLSEAVWEACLSMLGQPLHQL